MDAICASRNIDCAMHDIVSKTEHFSGADLNGVFNNAHLKSVNEYLSNLSIGNETGADISHDYTLVSQKESKWNPLMSIANLIGSKKMVKEKADQKV